MHEKCLAECDKHQVERKCSSAVQKNTKILTARCCEQKTRIRSAPLTITGGHPTFIFLPPPPTSFPSLHSCPGTFSRGHLACLATRFKARTMIAAGSCSGSRSGNLRGGGSLTAHTQTTPLDHFNQFVNFKKFKIIIKIIIILVFCFAVQKILKAIIIVII